MTDTELPALEFLVDELLLEPDTPRGQTCAKHIYLHVYRGAVLDAHVARLLAGTYDDYVTCRNVGWALALHAYRHDDAALVETLLAGRFALALLQLDHRHAVGPAVITTLAGHAARVADPDRAHVFIALQRLGQHGAQLAPAIDVALAQLGTPARGRGHARVDLDALARGLLRRAAQTDGARVRSELERLAAGKGKPAKSARELLDMLA